MPEIRSPALGHHRCLAQGPAAGSREALGSQTLQKANLACKRSQELRSTKPALRAWIALALAQCWCLGGLGPQRTPTPRPPKCWRWLSCILRGARSRPYQRMLINFALRRKLAEPGRWHGSLPRGQLTGPSPFPFVDPLATLPFAVGTHRLPRTCPHAQSSQPRAPWTAHLSGLSPLCPLSFTSATLLPSHGQDARLLPSFAGYTLEPVTASQTPKRNEKRTK